jgi:hypothetical protein
MTDLWLYKKVATTENFNHQKSLIYHRKYVLGLVDYYDSVLAISDG